jgi:uncharacterized protein with HEPN domain
MYNKDLANVDAEEVFGIIQNDLDPLIQAIDHIITKLD